MKKLTLLATLSVSAFLAACGDDSSSSPKTSEQEGKVPASIKSIFDIDKYACSETENKCEKIYVQDVEDTVQCTGTNWISTITVSMGNVCSEPAQEQLPSEDVENPSNTQNPSDEQTPAEEQKPSEDQKPTDEKQEEAQPTPSKDVFSCMLENTMSVAGMSFSTKACTETTDEKYTETAKEGCIDLNASEEGMEITQKATIGTKCDAGYKVSCDKGDHVVYLYDEDASCDDAY